MPAWNLGPNLVGNPRTLGPKDLAVDQTSHMQAWDNILVPRHETMTFYPELVSR